MIRIWLVERADDIPAWLATRIPDALWYWAMGATDGGVHHRAMVELMSNPTITVYEFVDGREVNRRSAHPMAKLVAQVASMRVAFEGLGKSLEGLGQELRDSMGRALGRHV